MYMKVLSTELTSPEGKTFRLTFLWGPCKAMTKKLVYSFGKPAVAVLDAVSVLAQSKLEQGIATCKNRYSSVCVTAMASDTLLQIKDRDVKPEGFLTDAVLNVYKKIVDREVSSVVACCGHGIGRSTTFVFAVLQMLTGKPFYEFWADVIENTVLFRVEKKNIEIVEADSREKYEYIRPEPYPEPTAPWYEIPKILNTPFKEVHMNGIKQALTKILGKEPNDSEVYILFMSNQVQYLLSLYHLLLLKRYEGAQA